MEINEQMIREIVMQVMQGMEQPSPLLLYLGGEGETVILFRYPFPLFLYQPANTDPPDHGRCDSESFDHGVCLLAE